MLRQIPVGEIEILLECRNIYRNSLCLDANHSVLKGTGKEIAICLVTGINVKVKVTL
jgi:hypothetical protein